MPIICQHFEVVYPPRPVPAVRHEGRQGSAWLSFLIPGLGQLRQRRWVDAAIHFGAVTTYIVAIQASGLGNAVWFAMLWNWWSAFDAYLNDRRTRE